MQASDCLTWPNSGFQSNFDSTRLKICRATRYLRHDLAPFLRLEYFDGVRRAISIVLLLSVIAATPALRVVHTGCSSRNGVSTDCCTSRCPASTATRTIRCCSFSNEAPSARMIPSASTPNTDSPLILSAWMKPTTVSAGLRQFARFIRLGPAPPSLLCSRQI